MENGGPALAKVKQTLENPGMPNRLSASDMLQAYQDISKAVGDDAKAGGQIRPVLENILARALPSGDISAFKALNQTWGNLEDVNTAFNNGKGRGTGKLTEYLTPKSIEYATGKSFNGNGAIPNANTLINQSNVGPAITKGPDVPFLSQAGEAAAHLARWIPGKAANLLDKNILGSGPQTKAIADALRGIARNAPVSFQGGQDAPQ
jgi:hypothetical protein